MVAILQIQRLTRQNKTGASRMEGRKSRAFRDERSMLDRPEINVEFKVNRRRMALG